MKLKEIHRTSTFAWSPTSSLPLLATGTVAGALDESFSNESQLEIWAPDFFDKHEYDLGTDGQHGPKGIVKDSARFNRLAWGCVDDLHSRGVIAAGMENGELSLWDPKKILEGVGASESLILRNTMHTGPVRGLDFNPIQTNLLSSGAVNGEVYIWDLKDPSKPYTPTPGARSTKLDEITSMAWNQQVQYVLAGASSTGYTVVWDLRGKREVVALAYGGGAGTLAGQVGSGSGMAVGGRRGMSDIAWHPDNATRLVTASEDDSSPVIMVWDLRNARAPEKILTGHEKGVLSLSWCKQDADLLLSCGKDNRALCWNPQTSEIIGELPSANNWAFQVDWCPRHPDLLATAFFDGTIGIHSIQSTNDSAGEGDQAAAHKPDGADIFDVPGFSRSSQGSTLSLKQPPKWLRCPISASFGFGGKLVSVSNLPSAQGKHQGGVVHIRNTVTEQELVDRARKLQAAIEGESLKAFTEERSGEADETNANEGEAGWRALLSLFKADSRDELVTLLGFSKAEIVVRVAEAIENLKIAAGDGSTLRAPSDEGISSGKSHEPAVFVAELERPEGASENSDGERDEGGFGSAGFEKTPSEVSTSVASDATSALRLADSESTTTAPSLFGDDNPVAPHIEAGADFFSTIGVTEEYGGSHQMLVPHHNYGVDSSVAATVGSGPSSVTSENMKNNAFRIYPSDESDTDRLITKALVLGDFESAVSLCLSSDRFADAILLAVKGGPELLQRTQKAYFERRTSALPYLRLFHSIVTNDLSDIVQNADLQEWQEIFVVLCTFASQDEFSGLAEQLGSRLEIQFAIAKNSEDPDVAIKANGYRKNATLTYLAAGRLERLVNIWFEELLEEERGLVSDTTHLDQSRYTTHVHALQSFIEKVTVFRSAIKYVDVDLSQTSSEDSSAKTYKLSSLYDRYFEYAEFLAAQGLVKEAATFIKLTPADYKGFGVSDLGADRERLLVAANFAATPNPANHAAVPAAPAVRATPAPSGYGGYSQYTTSAQPAAPASQTTSVPQPSAYAPYNTPSVAPQSNSLPYNPATSQQSTYATTTPYNNPYNAQASLTLPPHLRNQNQPQPMQPMAPPPPRALNETMTSTPPPPAPPKRQENGGWNDAPVMGAGRGAGGNQSKPAPITSPFPNTTPVPSLSPSGSPYTNQGQPQATIPPPPRPGSVQARPPPPPQGQRMPGVGTFPQGRPASGPPGLQNTAPPARIASPQTRGPARQPTPSQYAPPPRGPAPGQTPPPGQYVRPIQPPAPPHGQLPPGPPGPYDRGLSPPMQPSSQQPGPYGPSQVSQRPGPQPPHGGVPPPHVGVPPPHVGVPPSHVGVPQPHGIPPSHGIPPPPPGVPPPHSGGPHPGGPAGPPRATSSLASSRVQKGPPPPKYPPGDRSHIPDSVRPAYNVISEQLNRLKQTTPPQQKRLVDDLERRINPLFDALNCETLSKPVVDQLLVLSRAMESHDRSAALAIHVDLLTKGSLTDDIGLWMSGIKQLIMRL